MAEARKPAYYAVLPAKVRYDTDLRPNAKLLYAEITALADASGYSWATNDYFAKLFDLSPKTVSDLIKTLARCGYLVVEVIRNERNEVIERRLWIDKPPTITEEIPPPKNEGTPPLKNGHKNNIDIRNTNPLIPQGEKRARKNVELPVWKPERFAAFWKFYPRGEARQAAIRAWDKLRPDDALITRMGQTLVRQMATPEWQRGVGIPYASSWLNQRRWEDEKKQPPIVQGTQGAGYWAPDPEVM